MRRFTLDEVAAKAADYFSLLDAAVDRASHHREGLVADLPSWMLANRRITVAFLEAVNAFTIRAVPDDSLETDVVDVRRVTSQEDFQGATEPFPLTVSPDFRGALWVGDVRLENTSQPMLPPAFEARGVLALISNDAALQEALSESKAQKSVAEGWARVELRLERGTSVYQQLNIIFKRFSALIRRKAWKERRIHRFINEHRLVMLPAHKSCYYEHPVIGLGKTRVADFILERDTAFPALLIELESPLSPLFKQSGELTFEANHAREQIREWASMIDDDPANRNDDMRFLRGPKQRLVVQGEGLRFIEKMRESAFADTVVWTYDMLLLEARENAHRLLQTLHRLTGGTGSDIPPFA